MSIYKVPEHLLEKPGAQQLQEELSALKKEGDDLLEDPRQQIARCERELKEIDVKAAGILPKFMEVNGGNLETNRQIIKDELENLLNQKIRVHQHYIIQVEVQCMKEGNKLWRKYTRAAR